MAQLATIVVDGQPRVFSGDEAGFFQNPSDIFSTAIEGNKAVIFDQGFDGIAPHPFATVTQVGSNGGDAQPTAVANAGAHSNVASVVNANANAAASAAASVAANAVANADANAAAASNNENGNQSGSGNVAAGNSGNGSSSDSAQPEANPAAATAVATTSNGGAVVVATATAGSQTADSTTQATTLSTEVSAGSDKTTVLVTQVAPSASAAPTFNPANAAAAENNTLSAGTKAGIAVGVTAIVALVAMFVAWLWLTRRRRLREMNRQGTFTVGSVTNVTPQIGPRKYRAELAADIPAYEKDVTSSPDPGQKRWRSWRPVLEKPADVPVFEKI